MVSVPEETAVTTPVDVLTVAIIVLLLLHVPPVVASVSVVVAPGQIAVVPPPIAATVTGATMVTAYLATDGPTVYLMVSTPAATPYTTPELLTVAMAADVLLQVPLVAVSVNEVLEPRQIELLPEIVPAPVAFTVIEAVATEVAQLLATE